MSYTYILFNNSRIFELGQNYKSVLTAYRYRVCVDFSGQRTVDKMYLKNCTLLMHII